MTVEVLQKLDEAFACDASDEQACFLAKISSATFYNYQKEHPEYIERKARLREMVKYHAKKTVAENVVKDVDTARWYLERKAKDEGFSARTELTGAGGERLMPTEEEKAKSNAAITQYLHDNPRNTTLGK